MELPIRSSGSDKLFSSPSHNVLVERSGSPMGGVVSADETARDRTGSGDSADGLPSPVVMMSSGPGTPTRPIVGDASHADASGTVNGSGGSSGEAAAKTKNQAADGGTRSKRRKMVSDCKGLRAQIYEFEQQWLKSHGRVPKGTERNSMQTVYTRYKELKKEIRDYAATDVQRVGRGFLLRKRVPRAARLRYQRTAEGVLRSVRIEPSHVQQQQQVRATGPASNTWAKPSEHGANLAVSSSGGGGGGGGDAASMIPMEVYTKYSDLLASKRDLKRKLKKFDEDFVAQWGRDPRKADKEVIRPMYQKYHEVRRIHEL